VAVFVKLDVLMWFGTLCGCLAIKCDSCNNLLYIRSYYVCNSIWYYVCNSICICVSLKLNIRKFLSFYLIMTAAWITWLVFPIWRQTFGPLSTLIFIPSIH